MKNQHSVCQEEATLYTEHAVIWNRAEVEHREEEEWENVAGEKSKQN